MSEVTEFNVEVLKNDVVKLLITNHDWNMDEASDVVEEFYKSDPEQWHENTDAKQMADTLASLDEGE